MANRLLQAGALTCASYLMMLLTQPPAHPIHWSLERPPSVAQMSSHLGDYLGVLIDQTRFN